MTVSLDNKEAVQHQLEGKNLLVSLLQTVKFKLLKEAC